MKKRNSFTLLLISVAVAVLAYLWWFSVPHADQREQWIGTPAAVAPLALPREMKVLVWNIYKEKREQVFAAGWDKYSQDVDLSILQEVIADKNTQYELPYFMVTSFERVRTKTKNGVATGSKVKPKQTQGMIAPTRELGFITPKAMAASYFPMVGEDESVLVLNIHALNFVGFDAYKEQLQQAIGLIQAHTGKVIFAGDFNTNFPQADKKRAYLLDSVQKLGLSKVEFHPDARKFLNTQCDIANEIDYVFVRGFKAMEAYVPDTAASDHCPLITRLRAMD